MRQKPTGPTHPGSINLNDPAHAALWRQGVRWGAMREAVAALDELRERNKGHEWGVGQASPDTLRQWARGHDLGRAPVQSHMPDSVIRRMADARARTMRALVFSDLPQGDAASALAWINAELKPLQGGAFEFKDDGRPDGQKLAGVVARVTAVAWWRRQLRRAVVRMREGEACRAGEVCAHNRQVYVTHDTVARRREQLARNAQMLDATKLENEGGQTFTLAELSAMSVSNPAIRRGELMTRIRGCEELAELQGWRGVFLTLTAPSRFHSVLRAGGRNPHHDGSTPRDAHQWLTSTWAKARARLDRIGVRAFGFRVAEPHHDGCPHWHALLWVKPGQLWRLVLNIRRWWLKDAGDEPGARAHRVKAMVMTKGGASGYIAKYIAKGIDDAGEVGAQGHRDDDAPGAQGDLFGGDAGRVQAWASAWGVRQFQPIGQPPVTVWRELRRVKPLEQGGASVHMRAAFEAVNREGARRADWALYMAAQGGAMLRRDAYRLRIVHRVMLVRGMYDEGEQARPWGVYDAAAPGVVHPSSRQQWRRAGEWGSERPAQAPAVFPPWTRVNNCTRPRDGAPMPGGGLRRFAQLDPGPICGRGTSAEVGNAGLQHGPHQGRGKPVERPRGDGGWLGR